MSVKSVMRSLLALLTARETALPVETPEALTWRCMWHGDGCADPNCRDSGRWINWPLRLELDAAAAKVAALETALATAQQDRRTADEMLGERYHALKALGEERDAPPRSGGAAPPTGAA